MDSIIISNDTRLSLKCIGTISLPTIYGQLLINNVLFVAQLGKSLVSIKCLSKELHYFIIFDHSNVWAKDKQMEATILFGSNSEDLFHL